MPPKSTVSPQINSVASLRQAFSDLALQCNLEGHFNTFAVDVPTTWPDIAPLYLEMFGDKRTDLGTMSQQSLQDGRYTLSTIEEPENPNEPFAIRARRAID
jgi:hypothetical protein